MLTALALAIVSDASWAQPAQDGGTATEVRTLRERIECSREIAVALTRLSPSSSDGPLGLGWISSVAAGTKGQVYVLHRDLEQDPVVVLDSGGVRVASWGHGLFVTPHSVRVDPEGNVWTVDSGSSLVLKFTPDGEELLRLEVQLPDGPAVGFGPPGATDVAFTPDGHAFVADGYRNSRVVEYDPDGAYVGEWTAAGEEFVEPRVIHGIAIDDDGIVHLADRENGRILSFRRDGEHIGTWEGLGKVYSISVSGDSLWATTHPLDQLRPDYSGWLLRLDRRNGVAKGHFAIPETHSFSLAGTDGLLSSVENEVVQWKLH